MHGGAQRRDVGPSAPPTRVSPLAPNGDVAGGRGTAGEPRLPTPGLLVLCAPGWRSAAKGGGLLVCQSCGGPPAREKAGGRLASLPGRRAPALPAPSRHLLEQSVPHTVFLEARPCEVHPIFPGLPVPRPIPVCGCLQ